MGFQNKNLHLRASCEKEGTYYLFLCITSFCSTFQNVVSLDFIEEESEHSYACCFTVSHFVDNCADN